MDVNKQLKKMDRDSKKEQNVDRRSISAIKGMREDGRYHKEYREKLV